MAVELREHYQLLKSQRDDLLRLQLQKERLMAFVVHDLKNPVNSMDLHAQILLRDRGLPESVRESATRIRTEARQLTRMILNLLDVSKGDEGRLSARYSDLDLRSFVAEVLGDLEISARGRRIELRASIDAERVRADEDLLRRTLINLVENAVRHAPSQSIISVTAAKDPEGIEIRVADAGAGVSPEMREKIFDPFVQLEQGAEPRAARAGRGLGLAFCKLAVGAHGGRIWVEDAGPGAVFCMKLPHGN
jgi:two-component system sensor histidine kinase/response regulator